jgi:hypothetical protein
MTERVEACVAIARSVVATLLVEVSGKKERLG